jgi:predicted membrane channel-forming protein YqfA (hemolysin III family)
MNDKNKGTVLFLAVILTAISIAWKITKLTNDVRIAMYVGLGIWMVLFMISWPIIVELSLNTTTTPN